MHRICIALAVVALLAAVPAPAAADGKIIVKYRKGSTKKRRMSIEAIGGAVIGAIRGQGTKLIAVAGDPLTAAERLSRKAGIAWAEPDYRLFALEAPNDPLLAELGGLGLIHAQAAWDALGASESYPADGGATGAILDTGIRVGRHDLREQPIACGAARSGQVDEGGCADDEGHGTHVAGTIAALANNGLGIAGVAFDSPLTICKALSADGSGDTSDVAACIQW